MMKPLAKVLLLEALLAVLTAAPDCAVSGTVRQSEQKVFFPHVVPGEYESVKRYATFPQGASGLPVEKYMGAVKSFYWSMGRFVKQELLPDATFLKEHLLLLPAGHKAIGGRKEDVVFLRYALNGTDFLVAGTGGYDGYIHFFISGAETAVYRNAKDTNRAVGELAGKYLNVARFGEFHLTSARTADLLSSRAVYTFEGRKWPRFVCLVAGKHVYFGIPIVQPNDGVPKRVVRKSEWFLRRKEDPWPHVPLERFKHADPARLRPASPHSRAPSADSPVAEAIRLKSILASVILVCAGMYYAGKLMAAMREHRPAWDKRQRLELAFASILLLTISTVAYMPDGFLGITGPRGIAVSLWQYGPGRKLVGFCGMALAGVLLVCGVVDAILNSRRSE